jgi:5'-methylthioadenosine phosphorylase
MSLLAFIGGTGFDLRGPNSPFSQPRDQQIETKWGIANVTHANLGDKPVVFLHRHARPLEPARKDVPPHKINYRANIAALKALGVTGILASTAVGCFRREWPIGTLVCLDNLIDFTSNREKTFFDDRAIHIDVTQPYCSYLRSHLLKTAALTGVNLQDGGTYLCADGPRFETAAEIKMFAQWGADVVGMTGSPELFLAREAEISYCGVSIVTNLAAGISPHPLTHEEVLNAMNTSLPILASVFLEAARSYEDNPTVAARIATREFASGDFDPNSLVI